MDFNTIPLFGLMKTKLDYASERQSVLAENVANADTPNYRAKDVTPPDFHAMVAHAGGAQAQKLQMVTTNPKDISSNGAQGNFKTEERKTTYELNPDGNNVSIDEEMMKVAQNQAEYTKTINLYHKMMSLFKVALGNSGG